MYDRCQSVKVHQLTALHKKHGISYQGQNRHGALVGDGGVGTSGLGDLQAGGGPHQPGPSGTEGSVTGSVELRAEGSIGTERTVDQVGNSTGGLAAATSLHALPVEGVVPDLSSVVEQTGVTCAFGG